MKLSRFFGIRLRSTFVGAAVALGLAAPASAQSYTAFDIGTLGGAATYGAAVNASGQVTGNSVTPNGAYHAFITQANGVGISDLGTLPGGNTSQGFGINASGQVAGEAEKTGGLVSQHAFVTGPNGSEMTDFIGQGFSRATGINDVGQVTGSTSGVFVTGPNNTGFSFIPLNTNVSGSDATDINASGQVVGNRHSFSATQGYITDASHSFVYILGSLNNNFDLPSHASAVNDSGKVVGSSAVSISGPTHAFIAEMNSNMIDLGTLGGKDSHAFDINSAGEVVGWSHTATTGNARHAFVTGPDGVDMVDLNSLVTLPENIFLAEAKGINDWGQILANGNDGHAYLLSPVPEPETYAMFLAGLGLMSFVARRRNQIRP